MDIKKKSMQVQRMNCTVRRNFKNKTGMIDQHFITKQFQDLFFHTVESLNNNRK